MEPSGASGATGMEAITAAFSTVVDCATQVWNFMIGNPYIVVLLAAGLVTVGFRLFRKAKSVAG